MAFKDSEHDKKKIKIYVSERIFMTQVGKTFLNLKQKRHQDRRIYKFDYKEMETFHYTKEHCKQGV